MTDTQIRDAIAESVLQQAALAASDDAFTYIAAILAGGCDDDQATCDALFRILVLNDRMPVEMAASVHEAAMSFLGLCPDQEVAL